MNSIETEVLKLIGEKTSDPDVFDSTGIDFIRDSINDAIAELCMVTGSYKQVYYLPLVSGQFVYPLAWKTDFFGYVLHAFDRERKTPLFQTDPIFLGTMNYHWLLASGAPTHYYHVGYNSIGVYPTPSSDGNVIELDCVVIPKPYTADTDEIKIRGNYTRACVFYAVSEFYASRGDANRATEWYNRYLETASIMRLKPMQTERYYRAKGDT